ncbi:MAG: sensor histidine kinase [Planctomycetota bacterium]|jgi:PAS domain S-box-containing protein
MGTSRTRPELLSELRSLRDRLTQLERERSELERAKEVQQGRGRVLERVATGASLAEALALLVKTIEEAKPELICSVLLLDRERKRLRHGAGPSLPDFYNDAVDGLEIGPAVGSCGTCAYTGERVIVEDVMTHPYWTEFRDLARRAGLRACWSHPIVSSTGAILGTFAMYYREPRGPDPSDLELITFAAYLAGIAIERTQTEEALRENEHRYRALIESAPVCIHEIDLDQRFLAMNPTGLRMVGARHASEIVGMPFPEFVAPQDRERVAGLLSRAYEGEPADFEVTCIAGGQSRVFASSLVPLRDASGSIVKIMGVTQDITERKQAETRQALMMQELDHRVKNNLATVLSIAEQTIARSESLADFTAAFTGRIRSMAIAHEMLAQTRWEGAELRELVNRLVEPHRRNGGGRISLNGASMMLPANIAPSISMVIHELVVNAAKYGSLSVSNGRVLLEWRRETPREGGPQLQLTWTEVDGPPVAAPTRRGRGTDLIERMITYQLHGKARLEFAPAGVKCVISVPFDSYGSDDGSDAKPTKGSAT